MERHTPCCSGNPNLWVFVQLAIRVQRFSHRIKVEPFVHVSPNFCHGIAGKYLAIWRGGGGTIITELFTTRGVVTIIQNVEVGTEIKPFSFVLGIG